MKEFGPGDVVTTSLSVPLSQIKKGDIITTIMPLPGGKESYYTHKVIGVYPDGVRTQGTNNRYPDGPVTTEKNYIGKVTNYFKDPGPVVAY